MPKTLALFAGLPKDILGPFISRLKASHGHLHVLETLPLAAASYTAQYADDLYGEVGTALRIVTHADRRASWDVTLVVFYLRMPDGSDYHVKRRFDMEALLAPLTIERTRRKAPKKHLDRVAVNNLWEQTTRLLRNARAVLNSVGQQITNRDNRTCLLLPRENYGSEFEKVKECVHGAVENFDSIEAFDQRLRAVADRLPKNSEGHFRRGRLVFRAPAKAGARHGLAPLWDVEGHTDRCVIRGRVRFGAPYDPKFHYDCDLAPDSSRTFVSCHEETTLKRGRSHVNIAPNDNVR